MLIFYSPNSNPLGYFRAHFPGLPHVLGDLTPSGLPLLYPWEDLRHQYPEIIGDAAQPTAEQVAAWVPEVVPPEDPAPLTDVDIARQYQQAYQAAEGIIFLLMGRVAPTLIQKKYCTPENVNAEGTKFMQFHRDIIQDFKNSGRHPDAGDQMYGDFVGSEQTFPWVRDAAILTIFTTTIPRNPK